MKSVLIAITLTLLSSLPAAAVVDLHMHLTMEVPLKGLYKGQLLERVQSKDTGSRFKSRVDFDTLEQSGLRVVIAAFVANPMIRNPARQIEEQIGILVEFCKRHPNWKIVAEPGDVLEETAKGNKVFVLSLEGAWVNDDTSGFEALLTKYPIRVVTPFHFTDLHSSVGRAADQRGFAGWLQRIFGIFKRTPKEPVSPLGAELLKTMIEKKIWVDLAHATDSFIEHFLNIRPAGYPILVSHTAFAKYYGKDRGISEALVERLKSEAGAVGLLPSTDMLHGTPVSKAEAGCGSGQAFLAQWNEMVARIGSDKLYLGSDLNAPAPTLAAQPKDGSCPKPFLQNGLVTAGDLKEIAELQNKDAIANFVKTWQLVRP